MSYGYYSSQSYAVPTTDPIAVDLDTRTMQVNLPGTRSEAPWTKTFTLHAMKQCASCQHAVILYLAGDAPPELLAFPELISAGWEGGAWRLARSRHGFVLYAAKHPYTVDTNRFVTGTCQGTESELVFAATLPAARPLEPVQLARTPRHLKAARRAVLESAGQPPEAPLTAAPSPPPSGGQLSLF
jgi:hypothetical protein